MKRFLASILAAALLLSMAACGNNAQNDTTEDPDIQFDDTLDADFPAADTTDGETQDAPAQEEEKEPEEEKLIPSDKADVETENTQPSGSTPSKPAQNTQEAKPQAPAAKPETNTAPSTPQAQAPATKPEAAPESKPEAAPESKPEASAPAATVGQTLLSDFKSRVNANPSITAQALADALLTNSVIQFSGGAMSVEPGLLSGFDNAEITGFSEGVMFAPMIGSIPFVGYVFTLSDGTDADAFVANLKANANPRWNICTEAEETVADRVGNKVFFVMCPKNMSE